MNASFDFPIICYGNEAGYESQKKACRAIYDPCRNICLHGYDLYQFDFLVSPTASLIIYRYIYPVVCLITVITNILVVLVLSKKHMRTPTNMILLAMALADLFVALVPFPFIFIYVVSGNFHNKATLRNSWCYLAIHSTDTFPPFCHNMAIWLTVLLAAQRCVFILKPLKARVTCSVRNVVSACFLIVIISLIFTLPKFLDISDLRVLRFKMYDSRSKSLIAEFSECIMQYSGLVNQIGPDVYFSFYYWSRACLFVLIPSTILVLLSILLINGLKSANERKLRLMRQNRRREALRQRESNNTTTMLVFIVLIFLIVNLPQGTVLAVYCITQVANIQVDFNMVTLVSNIDNILILVTYPINFAIYCSMSTQFRETFKQLFHWPIGLCARRQSPTDAPSLVHRLRQNSYFQPLDSYSTRRSIDDPANSSVRQPSSARNRLSADPAVGGRLLNSFVEAASAENEKNHLCFDHFPDPSHTSKTLYQL